MEKRYVFLRPNHTLSIKALRRLYYVIATIFILSALLITLPEKWMHYPIQIYIAAIGICLMIICIKYWLIALLSYHVCFKKLVSFDELQQKLIPALFIQEAAGFICAVFISRFLQPYASYISNMVRFLTFNIPFACFLYKTALNKSQMKQKLMIYFAIQILLEGFVQLYQIYSH